MAAKCKRYRFGGLAVRVIERAEEPGVEHIQAIRRKLPFARTTTNKAGEVSLERGVAMRVMPATRGVLRSLAPLPKKYRKRLREQGEAMEQAKREHEREQRLAAQGVEVPKLATPPSPWEDLRKPPTRVAA